MDFDDIKAENLVLDESFQRYCLGTDQSAKDYWENWLDENQDKRLEFSKAQELYTILNGNNSSKSLRKDRDLFYNRLKKEGILKDTDAKIVQMPFGSESKKKFSYPRFFAAAIILSVLATGVFFILNNNKWGSDIADANLHQKKELDKSPGGDKAILTLADGTTIILDSSASGVISEQGNIQVINLGGLLTYKNGGEGTEVYYNTISTPKGGQYKLLLADGSKVWLNASSSLRFPSAFKEKERVVELNGEGYFEIAHNTKMPFHVKVDELDVEVLGTHFNIMAYSDEDAVKTTLVEGKIKVQSAATFALLIPGQQAMVNSAGLIRVDPQADIEEAIAWKNGLFQFSGADMRTVMRRISRWYNIETELQGDMRNIHISGKVSRNLNLSQVIKVLEESGIEIKTKGNKIIASPKP
jgi:transmembrane sensor